MRRILAGLFAAALAGLCPGQEVEVPQSPAKVVVIPVRAEIGKPTLFILRRGLKDAIEQKADTVVLDMETPGGDLASTFEMLKALDKFPGKTVTYINREAISAGALISAGTDEIYFAPTGLIGSAAPVNADGSDINTTMKAKVVSYLKAQVRTMSGGKGYRAEAVTAMIDENYEFKIGEEIIKPKGELLALTAAEAVKTYGDPPVPLLGAGIAENLEDLLNRLHGPGNYSVKTLEITWSENVAQYLTTLAPLLMALGLVLMFIEFKTPGFGVFGISGIVVLGVVFFGHFIAGLSGHEPALFFLLGVVLLAVELLFFPGVMVLAVAGVALMLGSLVWSMADLWPSEPISFSGEVFVRPMFNVMIGLALAALIFLALLKWLPKGGLWGRMVLEAAVGGEPVRMQPVTGGGAGISLIGQTGTAVTGLFPSGQVEVAGKRYEARLAVGHAAVGTPVVVTGHTDFGLAVEVLS